MKHTIARASELYIRHDSVRLCAISTTLTKQIEACSAGFTQATVFFTDDDFFTYNLDVRPFRLWDRSRSEIFLPAEGVESLVLLTDQNRIQIGLFDGRKINRFF
jgi:hypothetical protein